jgi:hypothetical protein
MKYFYKVSSILRRNVPEMVAQGIIMGLSFFCTYTSEYGSQELAWSSDQIGGVHEERRSTLSSVGWCDFTRVEGRWDRARACRPASI